MVDVMETAIRSPKKEGDFLILVINFGSTSTKLGIFKGETQIAGKTIRHDTDALRECGSIAGQKDLREEEILAALAESLYDLSDFDAVVSRGGIVNPIPSGTYIINDKMVEDARKIGGYHPCSIGVKVAKDLADSQGIIALTVDPPTVDELNDVARISGIPSIPRQVVFQPLNHKQIARTWAKEHGTSYQTSRLIIAHMGGGVTVAAHELGRAVDVNHGTLGEGPMTPNRSGSVVIGPVIDMCFDGTNTKESMMSLIQRESGVKGYLGTDDMSAAEQAALEGDSYAALILDAFAYQVSKEIGAMFAVLAGKCDAILLTGGIAHSEYIVRQIKNRVSALAPVKVYPGEDEIGALAAGALRFLRGEEKPKEY